MKTLGLASLALAAAVHSASAQEIENSDALERLTAYSEGVMAEAGCSDADIEGLKEILGPHGAREAAQVYVGRDEINSIPSGDAEADGEQLSASAHFIKCIGVADRIRGALVGLAQPGEEDTARAWSGAIIAPNVREAALHPVREERDALTEAAIDANFAHSLGVLQAEVAQITDDAVGLPDFGIDSFEIDFDFQQ